MMAVRGASAEIRMSSVGDRYSAEHARLRREIERLRQENDDLRKSADIWIRLYERQLERAKHLAGLLARSAGALPR